MDYLNLVLCEVFGDWIFGYMSGINLIVNLSDLICFKFGRKVFCMKFLLFNN